MNRAITQDLIRWKDKKNRKPLLVTGVRQCGKTYAISRFGEEHFESFAYFNFEKEESLASLFDHDYDVNRIIRDLTNTHPDTKIMPGRTLVFFDEIQKCPRAITALKYFCEDMPELHLIAAGSLLGVALRRQKEGLSFPVGKVNRLTMYPMNFDEFVEAEGGSGLLDRLREKAQGEALPEAYTIPLERHLKNYYIVGGMPAAVEEWTRSHDHSAVEEIQDEILQDYENDFVKYAPLGDVPKISLIWDSIPVQIAKENNKFIFSHVKSGMRAKDLEDALCWLADAGVIYRHHLVENPEIPLAGMADKTYFKVYLCDVGLMRRRAKLDHRAILEEDRDYPRFKGAMAENYVLTQLKAMGIDSWFWRSNANAELDFITDHYGVLIPIEVKAADNTKAKSLALFCHRYQIKTAFCVSLKNFGSNERDQTKIWSIPLYAISRLEAYLDR